jgi:2-polyprenyl-3-methyl-5-hydroxy-6-metoxy-1,4-benzoquinol methylase
MSRSILLVPSVAKGNGSGHLVRCLSLARELGEGASIYVPEAHGQNPQGALWTSAEISMSYARELSGLRLVSELPLGWRHSPWDLVVLDRRATSLQELLFWERYAPVLAIDEGGEARDYTHYLIDILPRHPKSSGGEANRSGIGLLDLPASRRSSRPLEFRRVLVSFGGEDASGLTLSFARLLVAESLVRPENLTVVSGALRRGAPPVGLDGATILGPVQDLKEHLARYDLVFTQFGLTAFEAAWAGCGVVLLNPSRYHRELSLAAGFPEIGVLRADREALRGFLRSPSSVFSKLERIIPEERQSLADCIAALAPEGGAACPVCGGSGRKALYRDPAKSYFRCASCGAVSMMRFEAGREQPYTEAYFFEEYKRQYGRTYLEDWPALIALARPRLDIIEEIAAWSLGRRKGLSILDVGCAYGPFLAAAKERGHEPYGLDAAKEAADYVRRELGIPATTGDFIDPTVASSFGGPFDVLSMWYVIEHFERLEKALRNAAALVRPGGILALSTPSLEGASGRFRRSAFFAASPEDHFTVWEPSRAKDILKPYGFRVERIRVTGHHPERLPGLRRLYSRRVLSSKTSLGPIGKALSSAGRLVSRIAGLGDTFEIYAVRETVLPLDKEKGSAPGAKTERPILRGGREI